jgi:uncharacterized protein YbjT (DUF2867 family)
MQSDRQGIQEMTMNFEETAMNYFVTGATGFIGKRLVAKLLDPPRRHRLFSDSRRRTAATPGIVRVLGQ